MQPHFEHHQEPVVVKKVKKKKLKRRTTIDNGDLPKAVVTEPEIVLRETNFVKKPKVEINLPTWREVIVPKWKSGKKVDIEEDLSDEVFIKRHDDAEKEEQVLWEKWKKIREEEGKKISGRSNVNGWKIPDLGPQTPRLRSQRIDSSRRESSSSSSSGRISPSVIREICVLSSTPTFVKTSEKIVIKTSEKIFNKSAEKTFGKPKEKIISNNSNKSPAVKNTESFSSKHKIYETNRLTSSEKFHSSVKEEGTTSPLRRIRRSMLPREHLKYKENEERDKTPTKSKFITNPQVLKDSTNGSPVQRR